MTEDTLIAEIFDALVRAKWPECADEIIERGFVVVYSDLTNKRGLAYKIVRA